MQTISASREKAIKLLGHEDFKRKYDYKRRHLGDLVSETALVMLVLLDEGVNVLAEEQEKKIKGVLESKEARTSKKGSTFHKIKVVLENGKSFTGNWFTDTVPDIELNQGVEVTYTDTTINDRTYHNITNVEPAPVSMNVPAKEDRSSQQASMDLSGARNNAATLLSGMLSSAESPEKAREFLQKFLEEDGFKNLTKTLNAQFQELKGE